MIDVYITQDGDVTTVSLHQGEGTRDETYMLGERFPAAVADTLIGDLLLGAITVHGVGA
jgi:hypothetical protein